MISVMMCDDQIAIRDLILEALDANADLNIAGRAASGKECIAMIDNGLIPDILVLDISMPGGISGYEVAKHLQKKFPQIKVIAYSVLTDKEAIKAMIRFGVKGFVYKSTVPAEIAKIIRLVMAGNEYYPPDFLFSLKEIEQIKSTPIDWAEKITERELTAIKLIAQENPIKTVAVKMGISPSVVNKRIRNLLKKTRTQNSLGVIIFLKKVGLLD